MELKKFKQFEILNPQTLLGGGVVNTAVGKDKKDKTAEDFVITATGQGLTGN